MVLLIATGQQNLVGILVVLLFLVFFFFDIFMKFVQGKVGSCN